MKTTENTYNEQIEIKVENFNKNNFLIISFKIDRTKKLSFDFDKNNFYQLINILDDIIDNKSISNIELKDSKNNYLNFQKPNNQLLILSNEDKKIYLNKEQIKQLRISSIDYFSHYYTNHDIADLIDRNNNTGHNMVIDMWSNLDKNNQNINFGYVCGHGHLELVKKIYHHNDNKFLNDIFCSFEEFGLQMSMQPESTKVLKFFKEVMKEKNMELSYDMKRWVTENKLGRKIKVTW